MELRKYKPEDLNEIVELFYDTINAVNIADYSEEQIKAWSEARYKLLQSNNFFSTLYTIVAQENNMIIGYGNIDESGYLNHLYVHKDYQHRGIATAICNKLEGAVNVEKTSTHASITAKPFFEKRGYKTVHKQQSEREGVFLVNYLMEKEL